MSDTTSATARVQALPDSEIAIVVHQLFQEVFTTLPDAELSATMSGVEELDGILAGGEPTLGKALDAEASVALGRELLLGYAAEPDLVPVVERVCVKVRAENQDKMCIDPVLSVGLLVNLTYLVMTTSVSITKDPDGRGSWRITKRASPPAFVSDVLKKLIPLVR